MEQITINQINWKQARNGSDYATINDGQRTLSYWPKKGYDKLSFVNHLISGTTLEVEVVSKNGFFNIVKFQGEENFPHRENNTPNQNYQNMPYTPTPQEKIEIPQEMKAELQTSDGKITNDLNIIIQGISNPERLDINTLINYELKLTALGAILAQRFVKQNKEFVIAEHSYKTRVYKRSQEIVVQEGLAKTVAKEKGEMELQDDKLTLITLEAERTSSEVIRDGITNIIFAIKDRIKFKQNGSQ